VKRTAGICAGDKRVLERGLIPLFPLFQDQPDAVPYLGQAHADIGDGKGSNNILGHRYRRLLAFRTAIEVEVLDGLRAFSLDRLLASYRGFRFLGYRQGVMSIFCSSPQNGMVSSRSPLGDVSAMAADALEALPTTAKTGVCTQPTRSSRWL
jgi:hypothetical protein